MMQFIPENTAFNSWATLCKTVRPMLSDRCSVLSVLSVCDVGALWQNGWTDQDRTWHAGRPRPRPHYLRWGPSTPSPKGQRLQFLAHICCGQMTGWIKMLLGMKVGLGPGDFVLDGTQLHSPKRGRSPPIFVPCLLWQNGWMDQYGTWHGGGPRSKPHCTHFPSPKRGPHFPAHFYCGQMVGCIRIPLGTEVGLILGDIVLDGDPAPLP